MSDISTITQIRSLIVHHAQNLSRVNLDLIEKDIIAAEKNISSGDDRTIITEQLALCCSDKTLVHPQWAVLAGRLQIEIIRQIVPDTFSESTWKMRPILSEKYFEFVLENSKVLDAMVNTENDFVFDSFAVSTLRKSYLAHLKMDEKSFLMETPQYMYLRVATYIHFPDLKEIQTMYTNLSEGNYSHATPTLFNAGMKKPQLSSCFLSTVLDEMGSITKAWHDQAIISMNSGGLGYDYNQLRHSEIGQHGFSRGIVPWLKITNEVLKTVDQCFAPDTIVYTSRGPKEIISILSGDKLILEDGSFGRVAKTLHYNLDLKTTTLHKLKIQHAFEPVIVASCHPLLAFRFIKGNSFVKAIERLDSGRLIPEYTDVEYLDENYLIGTPLPTYQKDDAKISLEDCRMYGILLGDGYANDNRNEFKVYLNEGTKRETCKFVEKYLTSRNMSYSTSVSEFNCKAVGWSGNPKTFPFTRESLYNEEKEKIMIHSMMLLPIPKILQIFKGLMETDGSYRNGGEITIELTSKPLIDCLKFILLRAGIPTSGNVRDRRGNSHQLARGDTITTKKISYTLRIPKTAVVCNILEREDPSKKVSFFIYDNKIWSRVVSNEILTKKEIQERNINIICDLEMEGEDEASKNYLTSLGQAHNGGKRKGSGTMYLRDWHTDVYEFIELRDEGPEDMRAKDLFLGLMISNLFMRRVENDDVWSLFCPNKVKGLTDAYGENFEQMYLKAEQDGLYVRQCKARDLWNHILKMQIKKGMPFILYMDACNNKSNQKHSGTIRSSNLCTEILEVTNKDEIASCTLASVCLNKCVDYAEPIEGESGRGKPYFNFDKLETLTRGLVKNLNNVIDRNFYPDAIPEIEFSNLKHRPLGIGVQGLADAFALLDISWIIPNEKSTRDEPEDKFIVSPEAEKLNNQIFETMYYAGIKESCKLARTYGPYHSFPGSPASKGYFQFDLWEQERKGIFKNTSIFEDGDRIPVRKQSRYTETDWHFLRIKMMQYGLRNSLLLALMPTASSAHILNNAECFEPFSQLIYARSVLSGQFMIVNKHLVKDLEDIGMWNTETVRSIIANRGSLAGVFSTDVHTDRLNFLKLKYKTVFEIPQKALVKLAADRAENICQTQSFNCHMARPTKKKLTAYHFYCWRLGAKTGMYYMRQIALTDPINFSIDTVVVENSNRKSKFSKVECTDEICTSCNV